LWQRLDARATEREESEEVRAALTEGAKAYEESQRVIL
jgi:hypothetical protein